MSGVLRITDLQLTSQQLAEQLYIQQRVLDGIEFLWEVFPHEVQKIDLVVLDVANGLKCPGGQVAGRFEAFYDQAVPYCRSDEKMHQFMANRGFYPLTGPEDMHGYLDAIPLKECELLTEEFIRQLSM